MADFKLPRVLDARKCYTPDQSLTSLDFVGVFVVIFLGTNHVVP